MPKLIMNPVAGADEGPALLTRINEGLRERFGDLDIVLTTGPGDAERAGARAVREGDRHLFVAGGDGTLNEVLNGVHAEGRLGDVVFGILPLGTGNDFAAALGYPEPLEDVLDLVLAGHERAVDVGLLNDRCFVNVSAGGFVAEVSEAVTPALKTVAGRIAYVLGGAQVLLSYDAASATIEYSPEALLLDADGYTRPVAPASRHRREQIELFAVCNAPLIGGGHRIAPYAAWDDGWFDVCVVEAMPVVEFVGLLRQVSEGEHLDDPRVTYLRDRALTIAFDEPTKVNTDGQVLETSRCTYRLLPSAARFLAAPSPSRI